MTMTARTTTHENRKARFEEFDRANPEVWNLFLQFAHQAINSGVSKTSGTLIINRIRWECQVSMFHSDFNFKINDHHTPFYVRKFQAWYPSLADLFNTRGDS